MNRMPAPATMSPAAPAADRPWRIKTGFTATTSEPVAVVRFAPAAFASLVSRHPLAGNAGLSIVPLLLGIALLTRPNRLTAALAAAFLLLVW